MARENVSRRAFIRQSSLLALGLASGSALGGGCLRRVSRSSGPPNFVILFADDMGYSDWDLGGDPSIRTPNLNRLASQGVRLTQFYAGNSVCTPSRAATLTGRNGVRTGMIDVLFPPHTMGLPIGEITIADALKPLGYRSACIGKWHLGHTREYLPLRHGFDYYYGLLYSNDMEPTDLWRNDNMIQSPADQTSITRDYTNQALSFIRDNKDNPFLLYLPYTMPHTPLFIAEEFKGSSRRGAYGDAVQEIDWSAGQIVAELDRLGLGDNTLVIFTSDNGPAMIMSQEGGSAGMLRGSKGDTWEGGWREPFIARWTGKLPAGIVSEEVGSVLDFFPTLVQLAGGTIPADRPYDGIDLMPVFQGENKPDRTIFFYWHHHLCAVRHGRYKLHFRYYDHSDGKFMVDSNWVDAEKPMLYDLEIDPGERYNLAADNPETVARLTKIARDYQAEVARLGENKELLDWYINVWPTLPRTSTSLEKVR
ncbi:sulfatase [candidate division KSB1 bacterium]